MIANLIAKLEEGFICLLLVSMTLLVFVEVVARFGFNTGIHWAQEVTLFTMAWFVLFGASYGVKKGAHIGVDVFVKLFPSKIQRISTLIAITLCLIYSSLFLYGSWIYIEKMQIIGIEMDDLPIAKWIPMTILVIGFVLLIFRFIGLAWKVLTYQIDSCYFVDEAKESLEITKDLSEDDLTLETQLHQKEGNKS